MDFRATGQAAAATIDHLPGTDTSPSQHAVRDEECELVREVLDQLEPPDRVFLELRYIERLSLGEIADRLRLGPAPPRCGISGHSSGSVACSKVLGRIGARRRVRFGAAGADRG